MARFDILALPPSDLNAFLQAEVGIQPSGMPVTVLSVLARCDLDPWDEAERLARIPSAPASFSLSTAILASSACEMKASEVTAMAERLVALLPFHADSLQYSASYRKAAGDIVSWVEFAVVATFGALLVLAVTMA